MLLSRGYGSSVGRMCDSWWWGPGFDLCCGRPIPTGWVSVSIMWPAETEVMVSPICLVCGSTKKLSDLSLGTRPWYSLVVDENVKKRNKQTLAWRTWIMVFLCDFILRFCSPWSHVHHLMHCNSLSAASIVFLILNFLISLITLTNDIEVSDIN